MRKVHGSAVLVLGLGWAGCGGDTDAAGDTSDAGGSCPPKIPTAYQNIGLTCTPSAHECSFEVDCQSGTTMQAIVCEAPGRWALVPKPCSHAYDSCGDIYCDGGTWKLPVSGDPPAACPGLRPDEGATCEVSGAGGLVTQCGYPCDPTTKTGWTIATCEFSAGIGTWKLDGACG